MSNVALNLTVASGAITIAGEWAQGHDLSPKIVIGVIFTAFGLSLLGDWNADFARDLSLLIFVGTVIVEGPPVFKAIGDAVK